MLTFLKASISGVIIAGASELSKRSPLTGAILLSVPLTSLLTAIWLYIETKDNLKIAAMLSNVFWAHIPTLLFFIICPIMLKAGIHFWISLGVSLTITAIGFFLYAYVLNLIGIRIYD
jgi:hypothetical protein